MAIFFTGMGMAGATPVLILGAIYFYVFFTYDENKREKAKRDRIWLKNREKEDKEKARIAKVRYDEGMAEIEKTKQEILQRIQKKQSEEIERAIRRQQFSYVYVLSNSSMPGILKIGYTDKEPDLRAKEISGSTGVPTPFKVLKEYPFATLVRAKKEEIRLHSLFKKYRVNTGREFFRISLDQVEREIKNNIKTEKFNSATNIPKQFDKEIFSSSNTPQLANKTYNRYENHKKSFGRQPDLKESKTPSPGIYADNPGDNIAKYTIQCVSCGKKFFSSYTVHGSTTCPHCLKTYNNPIC